MTTPPAPRPLAPSGADHLPFLKMEAAGNDFVLVDARHRPETDWPALAQAVSDRHRGIGSDGLLVVDESSAADFRLRMFNPDGTEDQCGNGIRCGLLYWAGLAGPWEEAALTVETLAGVKQARGRRSRTDQEALFQVEMGHASFSPRDVPATLEGDRLVDVPLEVDGEVLRVTSLSTGTAHTVIFVEEPVSEARFQRLSPRIETHPAFPERTSVLWTRVEEGGGRLRLRIWERAVGETLACGTGACAAAAAAWARGFSGGPIDVESRGGVLRVEQDEAGRLFLTGPAREVFQGHWPL